MSTILCATRGGEASIYTQDYAISLAKSQEAEVAFLYVADVQFLNKAVAAIVVDVATEIEHMGEFLLLMAKERAEKAGVSARTLTKRGIFRQALIEAAEEVQATLIVLGSPKEHNLTKRSLLEEVVDKVKEETGIEAIIVDESESG